MLIFVKSGPVNSFDDFSSKTIYLTILDSINQLPAIIAVVKKIGKTAYKLDK